MDRERRYPSDLTDAEWAFVEPMLPSPQWMGRPEKHPRRAIVDGILYVVRTGCAWRYLPIDFPPWQTVYSHFQRWNRRGVTDRILTELREQVRLAHDRQPQPTAGIIDSQSVRAADTVHSDTRGFDSGNKVNGRKRFIVTDTLGLLVTVWVLAASWQDRDGAKGAADPARVRRLRVRRPSGRLGPRHPAHHPGDRPETRRPARIHRAPPPLGRGTRAP
ncbi:IS5 family transposase [Micromonospora craniellae]|uniref:IS5 family transposase n=1 Tax=Micromonospora craniellae TaxID=2294034 RepID=A0A372FQ88_9ACTN|nr:IS5 family transposase [Micromonospora craniellae]QOC89640.1 IS5 family transposase [Micromonospora craniellae]RFS39313.1 IS5 family transposase [Micromonospora craniellae]